MDDAKQRLWWVYIIQTQGGRFYTGITTDIERRFSEHKGEKGGSRGAKFFRLDPPDAVVYRQSYLSRSYASKEESRIKRLPLAKKKALIQSTTTKSQ